MRIETAVGDRRMLLVLGGVLFIVALGWMLNRTKAIPVRLVTVYPGTFQEYIELRGIVELDGSETVFSEVSGRVLSICVDEGDWVEKGAELARLDTTELILGLEKAKSVYEGAIASLEDLKRSVKPEELRQAKHQLEQAEIAVETARKDYQYQKERVDQLRALYLEGAISKQQLKDAEIQEAAAEGALGDLERSIQISRENLSILEQGVSEEAVNASRSLVEQARIQVSEAHNSLHKSRFFSGIHGRVLTKHVKEGVLLTPGTPVFTIGDPNTAYVKVDVLVDDAEKIKLGQKAIVSGDILGKRKINGLIYFIAPKAETKISSLGVEQQRLEMRIRLEELSNLQTGYGVDVRIITDEKDQALSVPDKAVFEIDGKDHVFIVNNRILELRNVQIGIENDDALEIVNGLKAGEVIVDDPETKLKPGMRVKSKKNS
jgi:HlyD family secretion protein